MTIKYPLKVKHGHGRVWVEDGDGLSICDFNPLLVDEAEETILSLAEEMAGAWNATKADEQTPWTDALRAQLAKERGEV